uniref:FBA_2 domain-containing protein n=2 Tax=Caenorhabditis tropicalis TaxID=1561998 RepID=A0A1I7UZJ5_9PELO
MSNAKFRLLETTSVVFEEIVNQMEMNEIFNLTLWSRKTRNIIRSHLRKSIKYPLFLDSKERHVMHFGFIREGERVNIITIRVREKCIERQFEEMTIGRVKKQVNKYDSSQFLSSSVKEWFVHDCPLFFDYITYLFRTNINTLYCNIPWILRFIRQRQRTPLRMTYFGNKDDERFWQVTNYERDCYIKSNGVQFCNRFPVVYDFGLKRDYEYVRVKKWKCRESEDVLKIARRSKEVILDESEFMSRSLNDFFNHWLENRIEELKFLSIRMFYYTENLVFRGIENRILDTTKEVNYKSYTGELYRLSPGKRLRRDDGVIASFYFDPNTKILNFGVVTDNNGNK